MLGECADGNIVNAGFREFANGIEGNVAGDFQRRLAVGTFHRLTHQVGGEIVEHDDISAGF